MNIRQGKPDVDTFVDEFNDTYLPGIIPDTDFLDADALDNPIELPNTLTSEDPYAVLDSVDPDNFAAEFEQVLFQTANPEQLIRTAFYLVGHSENKDVYVSKEHEVVIETVANEISNKNESTIHDVVETFENIGLPAILKLGDAKTVAAGVNIGLQTHKRKNKTKDHSEPQFEELLRKVKRTLRENGYNLNLETQYDNPFDSEVEKVKNLDYALLDGNELVIGFELSFYTTSGSKPSETLSSYKRLNSLCKDSGAGFVWFIDGFGWQQMQNDLRNAYQTIVDVYNYNQASDRLANDILAFLEAIDRDSASTSEFTTSSDEQTGLGEYGVE